MTTTTRARPSIGGWQDRLAKVLTEVLAPVVLAYALCLVVAIHATNEAGKGLAIGLVAATAGAGIPYTFLLIGIRRSRVDDRHVTSRHQRPLVLSVGLVSVTLGLVVVRAMGAPREVFALVAAMTAGMAIARAISMIWKISIHVAGAAGAVAVLVVVFGVQTVWLVSLVAALAWSRVRLGDHDRAQVLAGAGIGAATAFLGMLWLS